MYKCTCQNRKCLGDPHLGVIIGSISEHYCNSAIGMCLLGEHNIMSQSKRGNSPTGGQFPEQMTSTSGIPVGDGDREGLMLFVPPESTDCNTNQACDRI